MGLGVGVSVGSGSGSRTLKLTESESESWSSEADTPALPLSFTRTVNVTSNDVREVIMLDELVTETPPDLVDLQLISFRPVLLLTLHETVAVAPLSTVPPPLHETVMSSCPVTWAYEVVASAAAITASTTAASRATDGCVRRGLRFMSTLDEESWGSPIERSRRRAFYPPQARGVKTRGPYSVDNLTADDYDSH